MNYVRAWRALAATFTRSLSFCNRFVEELVIGCAVVPDEAKATVGFLPVPEFYYNTEQREAYQDL